MNLEGQEELRKLKDKLIQLSKVLPISWSKLYGRIDDDTGQLIIDFFDMLKQTETNLDEYRIKMTYRQLESRSLFHDDKRMYGYIGRSMCKSLISLMEDLYKYLNNELNDITDSLLFPYPYPHRKIATELNWSMRNNPDQIPLILKKIKNINASDMGGYTPLCSAVQCDDKELTIQLLTELNADVNCYSDGNFKLNALHYAVLDDNEEMVDLLLKHGADPIRKEISMNNDSPLGRAIIDSPLGWAITDSTEDICSKLIKCSDFTSIDENVYQKLIDLAEKYGKGHLFDTDMD